MSFIGVGVTAGLGVTQAVIGGIKASKAHKEMEQTQVPSYSPNKAISDYYQQALQKASASPYASNFYQQQEKQAGRGLATGIGALQDRRSGVAGIGALVQGSDDAMGKAGVQAEALQRQAFGQLGQATSMKSADDKYAFDVNQMMPYEKKMGISQAKAVAGSQMENAGFQNAFGGLGSANQYGMLKGLYGSPATSNRAIAPVQGGLGSQPNPYGTGGPYEL